MLVRFARYLRGLSFAAPTIAWGKRVFYVPYQGRKMIAPAFPPEVWIENTNLCNAHCIMCPRETLVREKKIMELPLYEKIIQEVAQQGEAVRRVHMHNYGEPLLDKDLSQRIRLAKHLGLKHVYFVTNGSLLQEEVTREIILAGLDEFKLSFYGTDMDSYNSTMRGLDFDTTLNNVKRFVQLRNELKASTPRIVVQYLPTDGDCSAVERFEKIFKPIINEKIGDSLNVFALHNYGGGKDYVSLGMIDSICHFPWDTLLVLVDGTVVTCCYDYNGVQIVGDVKRNTISEIWNGPLYQKLREDFKKLKYSSYPVCMKCSVIRSTSQSCEG